MELSLYLLLSGTDFLTKQLRKNILIIPHSPLLNIKIRSLEIARCLSSQYNVYYLTWHGYSPLTLKSFFKKIYNEIDNCIRQERIEKKDNIFYSKISLFCRFLRISHIYNQLQLKKFICKYHIDTVISANTCFFPVPKLKKIKFIYDLVDDHLSSCFSYKTRKYVAKFIYKEIYKADKVIVPSYCLAELVKVNYQKEALRIPSGVDIKSLQEVNLEELHHLKIKYHLENKFVIGCIGNHGLWSGIEFLIEVFNILKKQIKESILFIVGPGSEVDRLKKKYKSEEIIFTGLVDPQKIFLYFNAINIGVLPFIKNPFTNFAFPLKIVEYGAARKIVIATNLTELKNINFPHVFLLERNIPLWVEKIKQIASFQWNYQWDKIIERYDWKQMQKELTTII